LCDGRARAGIGRYTASIIGALQDREDINVSVAVPRRPPRSEVWTMRWLHGQRGLLATAMRQRPHLLHGMASEAAALWPPDRQVVTVHDVLPWTDATARLRGNALYLSFQRRKISRCGAIIAVSEVSAREAIARLGLDPERVHVIPEGVDPVFTGLANPDDDAVRQKAGAPQGKYVLWVGSLRFHDRRKAVDVLLDAMARLRDVPLVMVGALGTESERVRGRALEVGVEVVLPGYAADAALAALYRGAAALAIPSYHEGFGLPMVEAMACGTPVVAARVGNLPFLAGDAALLMPPGDVAALAEALAAVLTDGQTGRRLRLAGPTVAAKYTWQRAADKTVEVYRKVAAGNR
jgi:glycosyltransferase involved in cell wall biosynthesis